MEGVTIEDLHMLGVRLHESGRHADAVPLLRRVVELQPGAPHYHLDLGLALAALNRLDDAIQSFQQAAPR